MAVNLTRAPLLRLVAVSIRILFQYLVKINFFGCYVNPSHLVINLCFCDIVGYLVLIYGDIHQIRGYAACPAPVGGTTDYDIETTKLANNVGVASADNGSAISRVAVVFKSVYPPSRLILANRHPLIY